MLQWHAAAAGAGRPLLMVRLKLAGDGGLACRRKSEQNSSKKQLLDGCPLHDSALGWGLLKTMPSFMHSSRTRAMHTTM
jgi:hypothetical protein